MRATPITRDKANEIVSLWHSHHKPVRVHRFAIGALEGPDLVGVVIVATPVAPALCDGVTFEVTRLCTNGHKNAASFLLGRAWAASKAMGVERLISYTRADELGTCYRAAGWSGELMRTRNDGWDTGNKSQRYLPGLYEPTTEIVRRVRWQRVAAQ